MEDFVPRRATWRSSRRRSNEVDSVSGQGEHLPAMICPRTSVIIIT
jgi:hypothetical protein